MLEREFMGWILDVAARFGWSAWHVPAPMRPVGGGRFVPETRAAGLPDLLLLRERPAGLIFAEIKDAHGKVSDEQAQFLRLAREVSTAGQDARVALAALLARYGSLVDSGDCGHWDVEAEEEVVAARAALEAGVTVGVYVWRPGMEALIEATLRGKAPA